MSYDLKTALVDFLSRNPGCPDALACLEFVDRPDCFERSNSHGHFTGSGLVIDPAHRKLLLIHHKKLDKWLQPGGHCDGIVDPFFVAWEEVFQETGLKDVKPVAPWQIADVNVQTVPEYRGIAEHLHYDIRYVFVADSTVPLTTMDEINGIVWTPPGEMSRYSDEPPLVRLVERWFGAGSVG